MDVLTSVHTSAERATEKKPPQVWSLPDLITRLHACTYTVRVFDDGGFVLQRVPLVLQTLVDDNGAANGMNSNDLFPMELAPYRAFLAAIRDQSWDIVWHRPSLLVLLRFLFNGGRSAPAGRSLEWVGVSTRFRDHTEVAVLLVYTDGSLPG
jgi:hypothetical protein